MMVDSTSPLLPTILPLAQSRVLTSSQDTATLTISGCQRSRASPRADGYDCIALNTIYYGRISKRQVSWTRREGGVMYVDHAPLHCLNTILGICYRWLSLLRVTAAGLLLTPLECYGIFYINFSIKTEIWFQRGHDIIKVQVSLWDYEACDVELVLLTRMKGEGREDYDPRGAFLSTYKAFLIYRCRYQQSHIIQTIDPRW